MFTCISDSLKCQDELQFIPLSGLGEIDRVGFKNNLNKKDTSQVVILLQDKQAKTMSHH